MRVDAKHSYVADILRETARGRALYDLLVLPGVELTYNAENADEAAHAVAVGLSQFVSVDAGIGGAIETARGAGAAIIAAHPFDDEPCANESRRTRRFAVDPHLRSLALPVAAWETSGIIDTSTIFGPDTWLFDVQAHGPTVPPNAASQGEDGQLLLLVPAKR